MVDLKATRDAQVPNNLTYGGMVDFVYRPTIFHLGVDEAVAMFEERR
jgi:hypothetical protein